MSYDVRVIPISEFLRTDVSGVVDLAASRELLRTLVTAASRHSVDHILLDGRDARAEASIADIWTLASDLETLGVNRAHRVAVLRMPREGPFDPGAFLELCATNRGFQVRMFLDFEEAFTWLTRP